MAVSFLRYEVSDLCLAKPALRSLSASATVADALEALKTCEENFISVWDCNHSKTTRSLDAGQLCRCVGKVCMVDVICYLCKDDNLVSPSAALKAPVSAILSKIPGQVMHVEPSCSLLAAIDLILQGVQNLVVPIRTRLSSSSRRKQHPKCTTTTFHNGQDTDILAINYHSSANSALQLISQSLSQQTSVAVVDSEGVLIGEISPFTLACCDESVAAAITTLSAGDLMSYIDCGGPPEHLVRVVMERLKERKLQGVLENYTLTSSSSYAHSLMSSSSDEESSVSPNTTLQPRSGRYSRSSSYSARMVRRAEAIVCHPKSSLVAVMIQAIAHRVNYVWVIEDDCSLVGIVTFSGMLKVFREQGTLGDHGLENVLLGVGSAKVLVF
ncbi:CBS domain-containing protein CBSX5 [Prunus yedoensis var. nudiflora]|uniref:CBS domain-containing protein CBSX5 n=1 Tax=Prunus yedoensis var. nudiflora TaxID=2094558 RepID=A0A315ACG2_PRUYE|nr:CBS domain-containing protein CBSX5 [Prunus yedoensis var. nudiflora]